MQSLTSNHAFLDGNKRIAFALTAVFLRLNGLRFVLDADSAESFLIDRVIVGKADVEEIAAWLAEHVQALP
jgi:death-on-curing protein